MGISPGTRLDVYEIQSAIGAGGMGEVYRAHDTRLKRDVAIKVLPQEFARDADHVSRFNREAELLASVNHPNLAAIYSLGEFEGRPFIVMELLEGQTLETKIGRQRPTLNEIIDLSTQIADALDAAHARGVIHRDIKPSNIYVTVAGQAKVLDFGIAKLVAKDDSNVTSAPTVSQLTKAGMAVGTMAYMSPEQIRGEDLDRRTDLFSFGLVLYEMTTGQQAFVGATSGVILEAILNRVPTPPAQVNPTIPDDLQRIIHKLLEKDRSLRFQSAADLRADLQRLRRRSDSGQIATVKKSIVVLPFSELSATRDNEYFADGLTDEIITDLSQIQTLRVISRNSSMQLKGSTRDLKTIAQELNVQYVLEGTVRKAGDSLRVTAQLIDPIKDEHLWADKYSGKLEDIFDIQEKISRTIVEALKMKLSPKEDKELSARPVPNVHAFECYHRARNEIYKFTPEGLDQALSLIKNALNIVGDNELLYGALGIVYWQYINAALTSDMSYLDKAEECSRKAFELNSDSAAGHLLVGLVHHKRGRLSEAIRSLKRARSIEPNNLYAMQELQRVYMACGKEEQARAFVDQVMAVDPLNVINYTARFTIDLMGGRPERNEAGTVQCLTASPEVAMLRSSYVLSLIYRQRLDEARKVLAEAPESRTLTISHRHCLFLQHALEGRRAEALAIFTEEAKAGARAVEYWSWIIADCYALVDETDQALDWLENAVRLGLIHHPFLSQHDVILHKLHGHPRYEKLMKEVKFAWEHLEA